MLDLDLSLAVGFGVVVIACAFLSVLIAQAALAPEMRHDRRYVIIAWSLWIGTIGVGILSINRVLEPLINKSLPNTALLTAGVILAVSRIAMMHGASIGHRKAIMAWYALCCTLWAIFCIVYMT